MHPVLTSKCHTLFVFEKQLTSKCHTLFVFDQWLCFFLIVGVRSDLLQVEEGLRQPMTALLHQYFLG